MATDLDRLTKIAAIDPKGLSREELEAVARAGREVTARDSAVVVPTSVETVAPAESGWFSGYKSTEFLITSVTTVFSMWVGYRIIIDPDLDLQRAATALAAVVGVAWYYVKMRTELKKVSAEAGTTTIKTPGSVEGAGQNVVPMVRRNGNIAA